MKNAMKLSERQLQLISTSGMLYAYGSQFGDFADEAAFLRNNGSIQDLHLIENAADLESADPATLDKCMSPICEFREGTFSFDGEAPTTTPLNYEDGTSFYIAVGKGTESFTGEIPDFDATVLEYLFGAEAVTGMGLLEGYDNYAMGRDIPTTRNMVILVKFKGGSYSHFIYPNATVTVSKTGSMSADNCLSVTMTVSAQPSTDALITGHNIILCKKSDGLTNPITTFAAPATWNGNANPRSTSASFTFDLNTSAVSDYGVVVELGTTVPTIASTIKKSGSIRSDGQHYATVTGLTASTAYTACGYATVGGTTYYTPTVAFTTAA